MRFLDRMEAGLHLARALAAHRTADAVVLGVPPGGVVVGAQVARSLGLPLEVLVACRIPAPLQEGLCLGGVAEGGVRHVDIGLAGVLHVPPSALQGAIRDAEREVAHRVELFRQGRALPDLHGRTALLVDDGIARGVTMRAAVDAARRLRPAHLVVAAPVASGFAADALASQVDAVVTLVRPAVLRAIREWYEDFQELEDADVLAWLQASPPATAGEHALA
jgi:predicted phosphoribosyltransferase